MPNGGQTSDPCVRLTFHARGLQGRLAHLNLEYKQIRKDASEQESLELPGVVQPLVFFLVNFVFEGTVNTSESSFFPRRVKRLRSNFSSSLILDDSIVPKTLPKYLYSTQWVQLLLSIDGTCFSNVLLRLFLHFTFLKVHFWKTYYMADLHITIHNHRALSRTKILVF